MKLSTVTPFQIRRALLLREEIALLDVRYKNRARHGTSAICRQHGG